MMTETAKILDGKYASQQLLAQVTSDVARLTPSQKPKLVAVLVGDNPASEIYVARKIKIAEQVGITSALNRFPADIDHQTLIDHIHQLNADASVHAVLVQLPLPRQLDTDAVLQTVAVEKDVDGFHPLNLGKLVMGIESPALPCTPAGIMQLLKTYEIELSGLNAVVIGRSNIVGKPITLMLTHQNATVTLCHSRTRNLEAIVAQADIIIAAVGQANLVKVVKPGAIVVDVGMNRLPSGKVVGDVDFEAVKLDASYITPVPGGVGPMTIAMLMMNTLRLFQAQQGQRVSPLLFGVV